MPAINETTMSDPQPKFGRSQPDGTFRPDDTFVPDGGIEHSAGMARLFKYFEVARDAEYLARVAVGQDPHNPVPDKRRVKRPRCVEDLLKRLCWMNAPSSVMEKKYYPGRFGPDGQRWITRRELEHWGDKRAWGGKFSEDQMDRALEALESAGIIERDKFFNPTNRTSKISIRLCPLAIMDILAGRKEVGMFGKKKPTRKRAAPNIAADMLFLKPGQDWMPAIHVGEHIRAAARDMFYEPTLKKYLLPLSACLKGMPCKVPNRADRRQVVEDSALVGFLKQLLKKWAVYPENHEFKHSPLAFTRDAWRALSHDELKANGFTEAQIVRCKGLLVASGFLEWVNLRSPGKNEPRIYARLRLDLIVDWIREYDQIRCFSWRPEGSEDGWIPSVIDPRSSSSFVYEAGGNCARPMTDHVAEEIAIADVCVQLKGKVYPAGAGDTISSVASYAEKCRSALLKAPLASGDDRFRLITALFSEIFADYFASPGNPFDHKLASRLNVLVHHGALAKKMTLDDLRKWQAARNFFNPGNSEEEWKLGQEPKNPDEMHKMLDHWSGIKRLLYLNQYWSTDTEASGKLEDWKDVSLANWKTEIEGWKNAIQGYKQVRTSINLVREDFLLPVLVALHELGLREQLTEFIGQNQARLQKAMNADYFGWHFALAVLKEYPELIRELNLLPEFWSRLRQKLQRTFHKVQVRQAQARLEENAPDDLNAVWVINPDIG